MRTAVGAEESSPKRVFISAGEASGDAIGAALVDEMRRIVGQTWQDEIRHRLAGIFGAQDLADDADLDRISQADSLELVEYVMAFEDEFGIDIPDADLDHLQSFGSAVAYIRRRTGADVKGNAEPALQFEAVGGSALKSARANVICNSSNWGAVGVAQSLRVVPRALNGLSIAKSLLKLGDPGLLIPIDFGYFNVRLARHAKEHGWKVLYFMPPGSWRRGKQGKDLPEIADAIVTPFPWSAEVLNQMGASAHWFGHPLKQIIAERTTLATADRSGMAVLPGSRTHEIALNLPLICKALQDLKGQVSQVEIALAPSVSAFEVEQIWRAFAPTEIEPTFTQCDTHGVLSRARAAIVCSGTATLEAALLRCPMVVVYRVSAGMALQAKIAGFKPEHVSLPNLILQRGVVPEIVGRQIEPSELAAAIHPLLNEGPERARQFEAFAEIDELTGPSYAITKTAELALSMLDA